jgi:hypothetical protein
VHNSQPQWERLKLRMMKNTNRQGWFGGSAPASHAETAGWQFFLKAI